MTSDYSEKIFKRDINAALSYGKNKNKKAQDCRYHYLKSRAFFSHNNSAFKLMLFSSENLLKDLVFNIIELICKITEFFSVYCLAPL